MSRCIRIVDSGARIALATFFASLAMSLPAAAADDGKAAFNNHCRTCHSVNEGDNRLGPSLHKIVGAKAGTARGYDKYSQGLKQSGIVWDAATLDKFIADPDQVVANNNMNPYTGLTDEAVRKRIVEFLSSQGEGS